MTYIYLDISTGHLMQATTKLLETTSKERMSMGWPAMSIGIYEYGYFVTVPPGDKDEKGDRTEFTSWGSLPGELAQVFKYATDKGAQLVRFDRDGEILEDLEFFNW